MRLRTGIRRAVLPGFALAVTVGVACTDAGPMASTAVGPTRAFLVGGDVSALARLEASGATYGDAAGRADALTVLARHGANLFRLRLFVSPSGEGVVVNDLAYTMALARRIRAVGARWLLALHYSDTWADPGQQAVPAAWAGLDEAALAERVESYTAAVLDTLRHAGALPDIVQLGNEIDGGFLWPFGRIGGAVDSAAHARFGRLLAAATRGVHRATTEADSVRILLHHSQGGNAASVAWLLARVEEAGVPYDIVGVSYYPWWHGGLSDLRATLRYVAQVHHRDVLVVETAYPWDTAWTPSGVGASAMAWPATPAGQRAFIADVVGAVRDVPDGHGLGVLWWYPEAVVVPDLFVWGNGSLSLFDRSGQLLPAGASLGAVGGAARRQSLPPTARP